MMGKGGVLERERAASIQEPTTYVRIGATMKMVM